jgi:pilus assembly protein TadC
MSTYDSISEFGKMVIPKSVRPKLRSYLYKAGIVSEPYYSLGVVFFFSIAITFVIWSLYIFPSTRLLSSLEFFLWTFGSFLVGILGIIFVFGGVSYFYLDLRIFKRTNQIEAVLADYLQVVSTNVKSGLSFEKSLWYAIKPKFGVLAFEMQIVLKKVMTGHDLADALKDFSNKYDSPMVQRAMGLLIGELDSGGKVSHIIDKVVINIKNNQRMKSEMASQVLTYMIFIGAVVVVISPALFALSFNLLSFIDQFVVKVLASTASGSSSPLPINPQDIDVERFEQFSYIAIALVSILSSLIIAILEKGDIRAGLKYVPMFLVGAMVCYFLFRLALQAIFGGLSL